MIFGKRHTDQRGITITELMVAMFASFIVLMGLGKLVTINRQTFESGKGKSDIQINSALVIDRMSRSVRQASRITVTNGSTFSTHDEDGAVVHTYSLQDGAIQENGTDIAPEACTLFTVGTDADTLSLTIRLDLADSDGSAMSSVTRVCRRNAPVL